MRARTCVSKRPFTVAAGQIMNAPTCEIMNAPTGEIMNAPTCHSVSESEWSLSSNIG